MTIFRKSPRDLCEEGEKLMAKRKHKKAIEKFERAIELGKDDLILKCVAELNMGVCYARMDNKDKALEHFEKSLEAVLKLLNLPLDGPKSKEGEADFYRTLFSHPIGVLAYYDKVITLRAMGRLNEAREMLDNLINYIQPQFAAREPVFRVERFEIISEMVERERSDIISGLVPVSYIKELYRKLGYSEEEIEKDLACVPSASL